MQYFGIGSTKNMPSRLMTALLVQKKPPRLLKSSTQSAFKEIEFRRFNLWISLIVSKWEQERSWKNVRNICWRALPDFFPLAAWLKKYYFPPSPPALKNMKKLLLIVTVFINTTIQHSSFNELKRVKTPKLVVTDSMPDYFQYWKSFQLKSW